jgi:hypothetical protein
LAEFSKAQITSYVFGSTSTTYAPITGGTVVSATSTDDDNNYALQNIGFTFNYNGVGYTSVGISANGYMRLGALTSTSYTGVLNTNFQTISAFDQDLQGGGLVTSDIRIETSGTAPNRVCVVQWRDWSKYQSITFTNERYNFQIRLNEASGAVEIVYGNFVTTGFSGTMQVGLNGNSALDFQARATATNWSASIASTSVTTNDMTISSIVFPSSGLRYSWTIPPMVFNSSTTTQASIAPVTPGSINNQILSIPFVVTGIGFPFTVNQFNMSTNGTTSISDITNAKIYYTGTSATFSTATLFGSVTSPGTLFNITGSQVISTGTNYFWLVYDVSPTASSNNLLDGEVNLITYNTSTSVIPTVQAPSGSRTIRPSLNGSYNIGLGGDYTTLTAACNELSSLGATGSVTFNLTNSYYSVGTGETFPLNLVSIPSFCSTCGVNSPLLTIRPSVSSIGAIIENFAVNGQMLFNVSGSNYISFDGRAGGSGASKTLILANGNTLNPVITLQNESRGITIRDCFIKSANSNTFSGAVAILGAISGLNGNDSIQITNNNIRGYVAPSTLANAIFAQGQSNLAQNDYVNITNNNFYQFTLNGIFANSTNNGNGSFWTVTGNSFYDTIATVTFNAINAINLQPSSFTGNPSAFSYTISNNFIGGSAPLCAGNPWVISSSSGSLTGIAAQTSAGVSPTLIQNNTIQNISSIGANYSLTGINTIGSGTYTIGGSALTANTIGQASTVSSIRSISNGVITGISNSGTGIIIINNNLIANLTDSNINASVAIRGITNTGGSNVAISNNSLYNFVNQSTLTGSTTTAATMGISVSSSGNPQVISGNTIGGSLGILRNLQLGGHCMTGIFYNGSSANNLIQNNIVSNLISGSTAIGATSSAAVNGILISGFGTLSTLSNNTISNLTLSGAGSNQVNGICATSGASTNNIYQNNSVFNIRNTATTNTSFTTSAALNGILITAVNIFNVLNNTIDSLVCSAASLNQTNGLFVAGATGNIITGNTISRIYSTSTSTNLNNFSSIVGLTVNNGGLNQTVSQNTIHTLVNSSATTAANIVGFYYLSSNSSIGNTSIVARNLIHSLSLSTTAAGGLTGMVLAGGFATVQNNMLSIGVDRLGATLIGPYTNRGIYLTTSGYGTTTGQGNGLRIYHNTINLRGSFTSLTSNSVGVDFISSIFSGNVDLRNNIISNQSNNAGGTGFHYGVRLITASNVNSNFNLINTSGSGGVACALSAINYVNLSGPAGWRLATKLDISSAIANPNFVNATGTTSTINLRLQSPNPAEGMGDNTVTTTDNFDGASRSSRSPVDIGADAGLNALSVDSIAPFITFTPLANALNGSNRILQASIYDNGGMYTSGILIPRAYYRKGINGTYVSVSGTLNAGSSRNAQWNFTIDHSLVGGALGNDSIYYYLIAQDSAGNIASQVPHVIATDVNTIVSHPSNLIIPIINFYKVIPLLTSPILVGTGNAITSLTAGDATGLFFN